MSMRDGLGRVHGRGRAALSVLVLGMSMLLVTACGGPSGAPAGDAIVIEEAWARPGDSGQNSAAYMRITNHGTAADTLIGAASDVADVVEIHRTRMDNGVMKMEPVEGGVPVDAGTTVELKPGDLHVMFMGLKEELAVGDRFELTLSFEHAGPVTVTVEVRQPE